MLLRSRIHLLSRAFAPLRLGPLLRPGLVAARLLLQAVFPHLTARSQQRGRRSPALLDWRVGAGLLAEALPP